MKIRYYGVRITLSCRFVRSERGCVCAFIALCLSYSIWLGISLTYGDE
jgi:hypothetical protein